MINCLFDDSNFRHRGEKLAAKLTEGFRKKFDGFNLTPPTSAQSAEATSPAGEARKNVGRNYILVSIQKEEFCFIR